MFSNEDFVVCIPRISLNIDDCVAYDLYSEEALGKDNPSKNLLGVGILLSLQISFPSVSFWDYLWTVLRKKLPSILRKSEGKKGDLLPCLISMGFLFFFFFFDKSKMY